MKKFLLVVACLGLLSACGQMGPLVPANNSEQSTEESQ